MSFVGLYNQSGRGRKKTFDSAQELKQLKKKEERGEIEIRYVDERLESDWSLDYEKIAQSYFWAGSLVIRSQSSDPQVSLNSSYKRS